MDTRLFITTHNTDFTELRGWMQPDGIWSTELLALGGMVQGAYQPGMGVDIRTMRVDDGTINGNGLAGRVTVGSYYDTLGDLRTGFIPETIIRASAEEAAELRQLEKDLGRSFAAETREQWLTAMALAQQNHEERTGEDGFVWMILAPAERSIGSYTRRTSVIAGLFTDEGTARRALAQRQLAGTTASRPVAVAFKPEAELTLVSVPLNSRFDLDTLAETAEPIIEPAQAADQTKLKTRYAELLTGLGL